MWSAAQILNRRLKTLPKLAREHKETFIARDLELSADGKWLGLVAGNRATALEIEGSAVLTGSDDGSASLWATRSGDELYRAQHFNSVAAVALDGKGRRFVTSSGDSRVRVREIPGERHVLSNGEDGRSSAV